MSPGSGTTVTGASSPPHFVLVPMMAAGHAGPMLDMARALASRGALVTFVTTPLNLPRLGRTSSDDALPIRFPCAEAGLPEGCESLDALLGLIFLGRFNDACAMLSAPMTIDAPSRSPGNFTGPGMKEFGEEIMAESARADGLVVNSFAELEPMFVDAYETAIGKKLWTIGPLFLMSPVVSTATAEQDTTAIRCASWLDSKEHRSVVFVSFGSLVRSSLPQLVEIAHGLERSNRPFIWAVKPGNLAEFKQWLSDDGFESRVGERGLVVTGWAPQKAILSHPATGAFVTHCGWNSVLECVAAGLPMVTWPHFAEQFMNEKLVADVLRVGVPVGVKDAAQWGVGSEAVVATREDVERAVAAVMDGGEEGASRRARAIELGRRAREAVARSGSSCRNVELLMEHVTQKKSMA
nr:unnamed protein product [Digitaria exilis]